MLRINGRKFAANTGEAMDTLFQADGTGTTFHGFYKVKRKRGERSSMRVAVELTDMQGARRALVSPDGAIVTAFDVKHGDRKLAHYMFGLASDTREWLGLAADMTFGAEMDLGRAVIREVQAGEREREVQA